jgi:hypothetical protein
MKPLAMLFSRKLMFTCKQMNVCMAVLHRHLHYIVRNKQRGAVHADLSGPCNLHMADESSHLLHMHLHDLVHNKQRDSRCHLSCLMCLTRDC